MGLVNYVVPGDQVMKKAEDLAHRIMENAPLAVRGMKEAAVRGLELPLKERLEVATRIYDRLQDSEDAREGLAAFQEKRAPIFRGR